MRDGKELIIPIRVAPRPKPKKLDLVQSNFTKEGNDINSSLITIKPSDSLEHNKSKF